MRSNWENGRERRYFTEEDELWDLENRIMLLNEEFRGNGSCDADCMIPGVSTFVHVARKMIRSSFFFH